MEEQPTQLGPFTVLGKIGEGGMGAVYKARNSRLNRVVALKLLPEAKSSDSERRARFLQEARAASVLNHPNSITIYEIGEDAGRHYIARELVEGKPLSERIPVRRPMGLPGTSPGTGSTPIARISSTLVTRLF